MAYRTSQPLHPTEDGKPKRRTKTVVKRKRGLVAGLKGSMRSQTIKQVDRDLKPMSKRDNYVGQQGLEPTSEHRGAKVKVVIKRNKKGEVIKHKEKFKIKAVPKYSRKANTRIKTKPPVAKGKYKVKK